MARRSREEIDSILKGRQSQDPNPALVKLICGMILTGLLLIIGVVAFRSQIRIYAGSATSDDIYSACMSAAQEGIADAKEPLAKAMIAGMMTELCTTMKKECDSAPSGEPCNKIKEAAKMIARG